MTLSRLLLAASLALLAGCATAPTSPTEPEVSRGVPVGLDVPQVAAVQQSVRSALKDPDSAQFGPMSAARSPDGTTTVCGYVNAKNSLGGYAGITPFIGLLETDIFLMAAMGGNGFLPETVTQACALYGVSI